MLTFIKDDVIVTLLCVTGAHEEGLARPFLFLHYARGRSGIFQSEAVVGELGVVANGLQSNVLVVLPPGAFVEDEREREGWKEGRMNDQSLDRTIKSVHSSGSGFH